MSNYAIVSGGIVTNTILWDGNAPLSLATGVTAVEIPDGVSVQPGYTYSAGNFSPPAAVAPTLTQAQASQIDLMAQSYQSAIAQNVTFTTASGVTKAFQADPGSISNVQNMLAAYTAKGSVPTGFYWVSADNTQVPFTMADLQGLAKAMGDQGWAAFQRLQLVKQQIQSATTVSAVQSVAF